MWKRFLVSMMMVAMLAQGGYIVHTEYEIRNQPTVTEMTKTLRVVNGEGYITLNGVDLYVYNEIQRDLQYMKAHGIKTLHLTQLSGGGDVFCMWAILNTLQDAIWYDNLILHTHADGLVASAAVPLFLLGEVRTMGANAYIMLHSHTLKDNGYLPESVVKMGVEWTKAYVRILLSRTTMALEEIMLYMADDKNSNSDQLWMNYDEAEARGFLTL